MDLIQFNFVLTQFNFISRENDPFQDAMLERSFWKFRVLDGAGAYNPNEAPSEQNFEPSFDISQGMGVYECE